MPMSLKAKLKKLQHKGKITNVEYEELIQKLEGHDKALYNRGYADGSLSVTTEIRAHVIDEVIERIAQQCNALSLIVMSKGLLYSIGEELKGGGKRETNNT